MSPTPDAPPTPPLPPRVTGPLPDRRELRAWTLDALDALAEGQGARRRDRGDTRFGDIYLVVAAVVVFMAMGGSVLARTFAQACAGVACSTEPRPLLALGVAGMGLGSAVVAARALGPVGLSAVRRSWPGAAPTDRAVLTRGPLLATALAALVGGVVVGLVAGLVATAVHPTPLSMVLDCATGGAVGVATVLVTALAQGGPAARGTGLVGRALTVVAGLLALLSVVFPAALPVPRLPESVPVGALVVAMAVAVGAGFALPRRIRALSSRELARGGDAASAVTTGVLTLDATAVTTLHALDVQQRRGRFRSRPLRGRGVGVVVAAEIRRTLRARAPLWTVISSIAVTVLAGALMGHGAAVVVGAACAAAVTNSATGGLRLWTRSTSVRRLFPVHPAQVRAAFLVVPLVLVVLWAIGVVVAGGLGPLDALALGLAGVAGTLRSAPEPPRELAGALPVATPAGPLPLGLAMLVLRGVDVAIGVAVLVVSGYPLVAAAGAVYVAATFMAKP